MLLSRRPGRRLVAIAALGCILLAAAAGVWFWLQPPTALDRLLAEPFTPVAHAAPSHPFDVANTYWKERRVLRFLLVAPMDRQIRADIVLHDLAIDKNTFGASGSEELALNSRIKQELLAIATSQPATVEQVDRLIRGLRESQAIHKHYLGLPPSRTTGSHEWHKAWMSVYDEWIGWLEQKKASLGETSRDE